MKEASASSSIRLCYISDIEINVYYCSFFRFIRTCKKLFRIKSLYDFQMLH